MWTDYSPANEWLYYVQGLVYLGLVAIVAHPFPRFALGATTAFLFNRLWRVPRVP